MTELQNILAGMPVLRAELQLALEETDANGEVLLTRQEAGRVRDKLKYLGSLERETIPPVSDEAARAALADFREALLEARTNQFKDTAVTQGTDALASKVQVDVLLRRIGRLEARLEFFAGTGKPLGDAPMTAAEIATVRGHIEAAQTLRRKYDEGAYAKLTVAEVGLVNTALDGTGAAAQLMQLLASVSVGADALAGLPRRERDLVCNVWMADLKAVFGETVTVNGEVRQRFTQLEAQELRDQLASVCKNARSGQDVSATYGAYLQTIDTLRTNTNAEVRYESASSAYTDAEARRILDSAREVKRLAEARGASDPHAIAAQQRYVDTVIEARDNDFVRETVDQLGGAAAPAADLALLRARLDQMRANLDYFGTHSATAQRLPASSVALLRGLLDRAESRLKSYADPDSGQVTVNELQAVASLIGAQSLADLSAMTVNATAVPVDKRAVRSARNAWEAGLKLQALTDHDGNARRLTEFELQQLTGALAEVEQACRSTAANREQLISQAWDRFKDKRDELRANVFLQGPVARIPGVAADDHAADKAAAQIARMQARLTYLERHEKQDPQGNDTTKNKAFSAAELTLARAVVEQASLLLRGFSQVQDGPSFSEQEYQRVLDVLVDKENSFGAQALMQEIDTFGLTPVERTFAIPQRSDIRKVWISELEIITASGDFTSWEIERLEESLKHVNYGLSGSLTSRWNEYLSVIDASRTNAFSTPADIQLDGNVVGDQDVGKLSSQVTAMLARAEFMERCRRISSEDAFNAHASISLAQDLLLMYQQDGMFTAAEKTEVENRLQGVSGTPLEAILTTIRTGAVNPSDADIRRSDRQLAAKVWLRDLDLKAFDTSGHGVNQTRVFTPGEARRLEESLRDFLRRFVQRGPGSADSVTAWTSFNNALNLAQTELSVPSRVLQHNEFDGVTVPANPIRLNGSVIRYSAQSKTETPVMQQDPNLTHDGDPDGRLRPGDSVTVLVSYDQAVDVILPLTGGPTLTLNMGGHEHEAVFIGGSGTPTLSFRYTLPQDDPALAAVSPQQVDALRVRLDLLQARLDDHRAHGTGISASELLQAQESIDRADYFLASYAKWDLLSSEFQAVVAQLEAGLPDFMATSRV